MDLAGMEAGLAARGYTVQDVMNYLADVNGETPSAEGQTPAEMLMIFGGDSLAGLHARCSRYIEEVLPTGGRTILITGGIGRLTSRIVREMRAWITQGRLPSIRLDAQGQKVTFTTTEQVLNTGTTKPLHPAGAFDLNASKQQVLAWVTEADMYLEVLLSLLLQYGYSADMLAVSGYEAYQRNADGRFVVDDARTTALRQAGLLEPESRIYRLRPDRQRLLTEAQAPATIQILVENASTHTGTNVRYALEMLISTGLISTPAEARQLAARTLVYQQPMLQLRSKQTVGKRFGALPRSFSYAPVYQELSVAEKTDLLQLMAGEYQRLATYSQPPFKYFDLPPGFDPQIMALFNAFF